jgi:hypothetical protein
MLDRVESDTTKHSLALREICKGCEGLSGRALRKIPFLAHAYFLQVLSVRDDLVTFVDGFHNRSVPCGFKENN